MEDAHRAAVAEAFSRKALVYDAFGEGHTQLEQMRARVRAHILRRLHPGSRLLELNAGTGADAAYFARLGYAVHATDISPGMLAQIAARIERDGLAERISLQACDLNHLEGVRGAPYDYLYSNMGGVNCTADLVAVARGAAQALSPGGLITWVVMPPICPWELAQALRGRLSLALRRLRPAGVTANVEGVRFTTWYYTPGRVRRAFGPNFDALDLEGLAVFTPPADHKEFPQHHPRLYAWLVGLDERLAQRPPFNHWGDFYILTLRKRDRTPAAA